MAVLRLVSLQTAGYGAIMPAVARESWTDERLDDLKEQVAQGFSRVDSDIRELRRLMFQGFIALVGIMITGFLSLAGLMVL
ncbi:MAG: hypothetical protein ACM3Q9_00405 [Methanosarcina sp.]